MNLPSVTIKQLLEAGVHLGHKTFRWNPRMKKYIFGKKNSIHIIDLVQTLELVDAALLQIYKCVSSGGRILFVSTKKQASETISNLAKDTSQYYVNFRWLGGMLTNWKTISNSIKKYKKLSEILLKENKGFTKKEILKFGVERDKLARALGGIAEMKKIPDMIFVIDTNIEVLAIKEATKLNIPIVAVVDTNSDPTNIDYPIPGNDDARRAISLYCDLVKQTILDAQKNIEKSKQLKKDEQNDLSTKTQDIKIEENIKKKVIKREEESKGKDKDKSLVSIVRRKITKVINPKKK